jgi:leucyl/phenylalanyl-tRNA---protein transferase
MFSLRYPPKSLIELFDDARRLVLGTAYALRPRRISALPAIAAAVLRAAIGLERPGACLDEAVPRLRHPSGFVGLSGDLDPETLMRGYRLGLYPISHVGRKKWWLQPQRMTIEPHRVKRDKDVKRMLRNKHFTVTYDTAFEDVVRACAAPRPGHLPLTWITEDIIIAYGALHRAGHAHSFEAWNAEGELVGGGFGIAVGPVFIIESQFTRQRNASKVAMVTLMRQLSAWGFTCADGKAHTSYLDSIGFALIPHESYRELLRAGPAQVAPIGKWSVDPTLDASADWRPAQAPEATGPAGASVALPIENRSAA